MNYLCKPREKDGKNESVRSCMWKEGELFACAYLDTYCFYETEML